MRNFDYSTLAGLPWPRGLEGALDKVGRLQASLAEADRRRSRFAALHEEQALVSCAAHCCAIDGREIDDRRLFDVACGIAAPASLEEQEALGVFEAMQDILVRHASMDVSPAAILALHRIMEGHARPEQAGRFKRRRTAWRATGLARRRWPGSRPWRRKRCRRPSMPCARPGKGRLHEGTSTASCWRASLSPTSLSSPPLRGETAG